MKKFIKLFLLTILISNIEIPSDYPPKEPKGRNGPTGHVCFL